MTILSPNSLYYIVMQKILSQIKGSIENNMLDAHSPEYTNNEFRFDKLLDLEYLYNNEFGDNRTDAIWVMSPFTGAEVQRLSYSDQGIMFSGSMSAIRGIPVILTDACPVTDIYLLNTANFKSFETIHRIKGFILRRE